LEHSFDLTQVLPQGTVEITFLIAFLGWMPAPLDASIWQSLWTIEKNKETAEKFGTRQAIVDFNIGFFGAMILGICFVALGAFVMYNSGETFSSSAFQFSEQLINLYTKFLGDEVYIIIGAAAFTTMFSTTLTTLDASPRAMTKTFDLLTKRSYRHTYWFWISFLAIGTIAILLFFMSEMATLVKIATVLAFLTAPFFAVLNYILIAGKHTPKEHRPSLALQIMSWIGIIVLIAFSIWFLVNL